MLCQNRISDQDYNYAVCIYTQNGSISQFCHGNHTKELVLQCGMQYFMNVTTECCGNTVTLANFNFQFVNCMNQYSHPCEMYNNISITLYFDCINEIPTSKS